MLNKYSYLEELENEINKELKKSTLDLDYDAIIEYIITDVENKTIYYSDCYDILQELGVNNFADAFDNGYFDISSIAYHYLYEYILENVSINDIIYEFKSNQDEEVVTDIIEKFKDKEKTLLELDNYIDCESIFDMGNLENNYNEENNIIDFIYNKNNIDVQIEMEVLNKDVLLSIIKEVNKKYNIEDIKVKVINVSIY